jgi:hypothetical protein
MTKAEFEMLRFAFLTGAVVLTSTPQPAITGIVDQTVEAFHRTCLAEGAPFDRMILTAHERAIADDRDATDDWEPIAEAAFAEMVPVANPTAVRAWLVAEAEDGLPAGTIIGVTRAVLNGKPVQTCTLAFPDVDHEAFGKSFFARTDAEKIAEDQDTAQISRLYILIAGGHEQFVRLMVLPPTPEGHSGVVASSIIAD